MLAWAKNHKTTLGVAFVFLMIFTTFVMVSPFIDHECEYNAGSTNKYCTSYNVIRFVLWRLGEFLDNISAPLTAIATACIGAFTYTLWQSSEKMWGVTRTSARAALRAASAAKVSSERILRVERAYLFLGKEIIPFKSVLNPTDRAIIEFGFRNYGKTPAILAGLRSNASYWPASPTWPTMSNTIPQPIQEGFAVGSDETQGEYKIRFPLRVDEIDRASNGDGMILFWGEIVYLDVFGVEHRTGWCRQFKFSELGFFHIGENSGFYAAGDNTLNYYT